MQKFISILFGSIVFHCAFSQQNFQPGSIITLTGDTVKGSIDYRNWGKNPKTVTFHNSSGRDITYGVLDIKGFVTAGELYRSAVVEKEMSAFLKGPMENMPDLVLQKDTVFLRCIVRGERSLYRLKSKENLEQFYIPSGDSFMLLVYKKYVTTNAEGLNVLSEDKRYRGQLVYYLQRCADIKKSTTNMRYTEKDIVNVFKRYYTCVHPEQEQQRLLEKNDHDNVRLKWGILAGVSSNAFRFRGTYDASNHNHEDLSKPNYAPSTNFTGGALLDIILPRNMGKWSVHNEMIWTSFLAQNTSRYNDPIVSSFYRVVTIQVGAQHIKLNDLLRFTQPLSARSAVFFNAGISNGYMVRLTHNYRKDDEVLNQEVKTTEGEAIDKKKVYEFGLLGGVGFMLGKCSIEARFEKANGITDNLESTRSYVMSGYLLASYRF